MRKKLQRMMVAVAAMMFCLGANAIDEGSKKAITATLVHTAGSSWGSNSNKNTVDSEAEYYNNEATTGWAGVAFAEFNTGIPTGATITKATLTWTTITGGTANKSRDNKVYYLHAGVTVDYETIAAEAAEDVNDTERLYSNAKTFITNHIGTNTFEGEIDVTEAVKAIAEAGQDYIIFQWTGNAAGATLAGKASANAPKLVIEYLPGAPQITNASFEANGEKTASNGPLTITGWTETIDNSFNNTEILATTSKSSSQFGTSAPSNGEYSLFTRHGWNNGGTTITFTSDALTEIPAGDYMLSVDYKQHYSYDEDSQKNDNTKVNIALVKDDKTLGAATSPAAEGVKGSSNTTYFNDAEWSKLTATFTLAEAVSAGAQVVITLDARGARRSDFFLDNVQFVKVPGVDIALIDLKKAIEEAEAIVPTYPIGNDLFQYPETTITPLTEAIAAAQATYEAAESKEAVEAATEALNSFVADFAPQAITPDPQKKYAFRLKDSGTLYMNLTDGIKIKEEATLLSFVAAEAGQYYLAAEGELYVGLEGTNNWTMSTAANKRIACSFTALGNGEYHIHNAKGLVGPDNITNGAICYANKVTGNHVVWIIEEVSVATMSVKADKWGTFVAPFDVTIPEGVKAYTVTGVENSQIVKTEVEETIPANTPVVLLNETEEDIEETLTGAGLPENATVEGALLTGIYQAGADIPAGSYVLQTQDGKQAFYYVKETFAGQGVANRCYLTMPAGSAPLRAIFFGSEEGTTGIEATEATSAEDGILYNLAGQKVDASYKGIVVKQGKAMLKK